MGFSSGISEPIERPRVEWDPDDAYERSLDYGDDSPCVIEPIDWEAVHAERKRRTEG